MCSVSISSCAAYQPALRSERLQREVRPSRLTHVSEKLPHQHGASRIVYRYLQECPNSCSLRNCSKPRQAIICHVIRTVQDRVWSLSDVKAMQQLRLSV